MLQIGIIGCGSFGLHHAQNIEQINNAQIAAVCSRNMSSAQRLAQQLSTKPKAYDDHISMMKACKLDAVLVTTPNHTHSQIVLDAAELGVHVFCEKPMALSLIECDEMIASAQQAQIKLMLGYVKRFDHRYAQLKQLIDDGKIGDILFANVFLFYYRQQNDSNAWVANKNHYGGLYSFYSHDLDLLTWIAGDIYAVSCLNKTSNAEQDAIEETSCLHFEFNSGAIGSLICCRSCPDQRSELSIIGSKGTASVKNGVLTCTSIDGQSEIIETNGEDPYILELQHFIDCINNDMSPSPNGIDGRRTLAIATAAQDSFESKASTAVINLNNYSYKNEK